MGRHVHSKTATKRRRTYSHGNIKSHFIVGKTEVTNQGRGLLVFMSASKIMTTKNKIDITGSET